jgi:hypothetical protein
MISERLNPLDPLEKKGSDNLVAVHQPAQLRAPSNPIRPTKALQVFWKTLPWSYGNLIAWGIEAFAELVAAAVSPLRSLHELKALNIVTKSNRLTLPILRIFCPFAFDAHPHLLPIRICYPIVSLIISQVEADPQRSPAHVGCSARQDTAFGFAD